MNKLLLIILLTTSCCEPEYNNMYRVSAQKVTGEWADVIFYAPNDAIFYIEENRGSYYLAYTRSSYNKWNRPARGRKIKNAVVDFKILSKE